MENNFGERLNWLRKSNNETQKELASILNLTKQTISCYEKGTREPTIATLVNISKHYCISLDDLLNTNQTINTKSSERAINSLNEILNKYNNSEGINASIKARTLLRDIISSFVDIISLNNMAEIPSYVKRIPKDKGELATIPAIQEMSAYFNTLNKFGQLVDENGNHIKRLTQDESELLKDDLSRAHKRYNSEAKNVDIEGFSSYEIMEKLKDLLESLVSFQNIQKAEHESWKALYESLFQKKKVSKTAYELLESEIEKYIIDSPKVKEGE